MRWSRICRSKDKGGLGIKDPRKQNIILIVKWWWKLETQKGLWQDIVQARYLCKKTIADVTARFSDSPCWKSLLKVKDLYMLGRGINLNRGDVARLWLDSLDGRIPFKDRFPLLFETCIDQNCTVDNFKNINQISSFRRWMSHEMMKQWGEMNKEMLTLKQSDLPDEVYWKLDRSGKYTTK